MGGGAGEAQDVCGVGLIAYLAGREWICGSTLTLADLAIVTPFTGLLAATAPEKLTIGPFTNVQRWLARVQTLDAWKRTAVAVANPRGS